MTDGETAQLAVNTIRTLSIDAVQAAKSGHPGTPMALAPLVYMIWNGRCAWTRRTRSGPTATASCSRTATPRLLLWSILHLTKTQAGHALASTGRGDALRLAQPGPLPGVAGRRDRHPQDDEGRPFVTDSGKMIFDCRFGPIADAPRLAEALGARAGIVEHGLFIGLADDLIVASPSGIQHRTRPSPRS